jgi:hypothetical protein
MAQEFNFGGRNIILPGAYSTIKSGIKNPPANLDFGNILMIDTGIGAGYIGGAGINGEHTSGADAIYVNNNILDFREIVTGGVVWKMAEKLFFPADRAVGVSNVYFAKAATTSAATITFTAVGGGTEGGNIVLDLKNEGTVGNGVLTSTVLTSGYGYSVVSGTVDTAKFIFQFYRGTFKGNHTDDVAFDEVAVGDTKPQLIVQSDEIDTVGDLVAWMDIDSTFNTYFKKVSSTVIGAGAIDAADISALGDVELFSGGTETYDAAGMTAVLEQVVDLNYSFILCLDSGDDAQNALNGQIFAHISDPLTKFDKSMVVAGGDDKNKWLLSTANSSLATAAYYDSDKVRVIHGGPLETTLANGEGFRSWPALMKAAVVLGRECGLPPQVPITNKNVDIDGEQHQLNTIEREAALRGGVTVTYFDTDFQLPTILQGVTTLQNNKVLVNNNGTTYSSQLKRIISQINMELIVNSKLQLLNQEDGVNRNTLTAQDVQDWTKGYLGSILATTNDDNLIISFANVVTELVGDSYQTTYGFVHNREVNKLFFTGFITG